DDPFDDRRMRRVDLELRVHGPRDAFPLLTEKPPLDAGDGIARTALNRIIAVADADPRHFEFQLDAASEPVIDIKARHLHAARLPAPLERRREIDFPEPGAGRVG